MAPRLLGNTYLVFLLYFYYFSFYYIDFPAKYDPQLDDLVSQEMQQRM